MSDQGPVFTAGSTSSQTITSSVVTFPFTSSFDKNASSVTFSNLGKKVAYVDPNGAGAVVPGTTPAAGGMPIFPGNQITLKKPTGSVIVSAVCSGTDTTILAVTPGMGS